MPQTAALQNPSPNTPLFKLLWRKLFAVAESKTYLETGEKLVNSTMYSPFSVFNSSGSGGVGSSSLMIAKAVPDLYIVIQDRLPTIADAEEVVD